MALFCDFENVALGVEEARYDRFDISLVLERLLLKGSIVVKKAYCDWDRYKVFKSPMHQAAFELIEVPHVRQSGKNSADIRMVVDALDLCYTKSHVDTFVIISGDSDFSPLVSKLRENAKTVIGVGVKKSTSDLLMSNCDEFIFYDDLVRVQKAKKARAGNVAAADARASAGRRRSTKSADSTKAVDPAKLEDKSHGGAVANTDAQPRAPEQPLPADPDAATSGVDGADAPKRRGRRRRTADAEPLATGSVDETQTRGVGDGSPADGQVAATVKRSDLATEAGPDTPEPAPDADPILAGGDEAARESRLSSVLDEIVATFEALQAERGEDERIWGSMVKQTLKRRNPGFSESYYGFRSFNGLLQEAESRGLLSLERDGKSGGFVVRAID